MPVCLTLSMLQMADASQLPVGAAPAAPAVPTVPAVPTTAAARKAGTKRKAYEDSDDESMGSLKDFIVDDAEASDASEDDADTVETASGARPAKKAKEDPDTLKLMEEEAARFAGGVSGTTVGGRTLRSREPAKVEARKPRDEYYERFGRAEEERLMEKFTKKDIIEFVAKLAPEYREAYEATGAKWPHLTARMTLEAIREHYDKIKAFADLPDSEDEADESDASDDESEGSDDQSEGSDDEDSEGEEDDDSDGEEDDDSDGEDSEGSDDTEGSDDDD